MKIHSLLTYLACCLALTAAPETRTVTGVLDTGDKTFEDGAYFDIYKVNLREGQSFSIHLLAKGFERQLMVAGPDGRNMEEVSTIQRGEVPLELDFRAGRAKGGIHTIRVAALKPDQSGEYKVTFTSSGQILKELIDGEGNLVEAGPGDRPPGHAEDLRLEPFQYLTHNGKKFTLKLGKAAFVDHAINNQYPGKKPPVEARRIDRAHGAPDYDPKKPKDGFFTLGEKGFGVWKFEDNSLVDGPGDDLAIFEIGSGLEPVRVDISQNGEGWMTLGEVPGGTGTIDIRGKAGAGAEFRFVRLTDVNGKADGAWPGADIDAIAAINGNFYRNEKTDLMPAEQIEKDAPPLRRQQGIGQIVNEIEESDDDFGGGRRRDSYRFPVKKGDLVRVQVQTAGFEPWVRTYQAGKNFDSFETRGRDREPRDVGMLFWKASDTAVQELMVTSASTFGDGGSGAYELFIMVNGRLAAGPGIDYGDDTEGRVEVTTPVRPPTPMPVNPIRPMTEEEMADKGPLLVLPVGPDIANRLEATDEDFKGGRKQDTFRFSAKKGDVISVYAETGSFEPWLYSGRAGKELSGEEAKGDERKPLNRAGMVWQAEETGDQEVMVTSGPAFADGGSGPYRLMVIVQGKYLTADPKITVKGGEGKATIPLVHNPAGIVPVPTGKAGEVRARIEFTSLKCLEFDPTGALKFTPLHHLFQQLQVRAAVFAGDGGEMMKRGFPKGKQNFFLLKNEALSGNEWAVGNIDEWPAGGEKSAPNPVIDLSLNDRQTAVVVFYLAGMSDENGEPGAESLRGYNSIMNSRWVPERQLKIPAWDDMGKLVDQRVEDAAFGFGDSHQHIMAFTVVVTNNGGKLETACLGVTYKPRIPKQTIINRVSTFLTKIKNTKGQYDASFSDRTVKPGDTAVFDVKAEGQARRHDLLGKSDNPTNRLIFTVKHLE